MLTYFIRRLMMVIPTFIGITFLCFTVMRFVPGGPVEMAIIRYQQMQAQGEAGSTAATDNKGNSQVSDEMVEKLKKIYGFDKPFWLAYLIWLKNLCLLDMGDSDTYAQPVWSVIVERFPISIRFGITGFLLSYMICIPLGVYKAIKHGSSFDILSSALVFIGYSVPGWVAGIVLLVLFGGGSFWNLFPLGGIHSQGYETLSFFAQCKDTVWHLVLPVFAYMLGSFASMTILMKNSLMENLGMDYVRTAYAKGLSEKVVIFKHAFRNSLIPIATGFGGAFSLVLAGSYLIEKIFNINGFGLLGYESLIARDYPVTLGILVISSILRLLGNILSDFLYCVIDPRIRLE
ncbi:MAG: ABC transporter permease subunit [Candidatus Wallbacteria bacterium]|nr:ABC transporter permease subunit [Candidatus Wallbacteria bacterium]